MNKLNKLLLLIIVAFFQTNTARSAENEAILNSQDKMRDSYPDQNIRLNPEEIYERTNAVLDYFRIEEEPDFFHDIKNYQGIQTLNRYNSLVKILDPLNLFNRITAVNQNQLTVFKDRDSKSIIDYTANYSSSEQNIAHFSFYQNLLNASKNQRSEQLKGLRIALDPGHMGDSFWDKETGKYVRDKRGKYISEGVINLQTALLLKERLEKLGAQVLVTHNYLGPVTSVPYEKLDISYYARNELRDSTQDSWFESLLATAPIGKSLFAAFENSPQVKKLFSSSKRADYFIKREDLDARVDLMNNFAPDISLIIHYDTSDPKDDPNGLNPNAPQGTKAFVIGNYEKAELSSRTQRLQFTKHVLDQQSWQASLDLSRSVVNGMSKSLAIPLTKNGGPNSLRIEDGIYARNLLMPRKLAPSAVSYLECMFYNNPNDFYKLADTKYPLYIDGKNYPYSDRLKNVVDGIENGVIEFVKNFSDKAKL